MAYSEQLAAKVRDRLQQHEQRFFDKKMFGGLAFLINGKMCINISGKRLMCRYHPELEELVKNKPGYVPMIMRGKALKGYCYVEPVGFKQEADFEYWIKICLDFNEELKVSK